MRAKKVAGQLPEIVSSLEQVSGVHVYNGVRQTTITENDNHEGGYGFRALSDTEVLRRISIKSDFSMPSAEGEMGHPAYIPTDLTLGIGALARISSGESGFDGSKRELGKLTQVVIGHAFDEDSKHDTSRRETRQQALKGDCSESYRYLFGCLGLIDKFKHKKNLPKPDKI